MPSPRFPLPQGTLDMLILQILSLGAAHGYGVAQRALGAIRIRAARVGTLAAIALAQAAALIPHTAEAGLASAKQTFLPPGAAV